MKAIRVIKREYMENIRKKSFIISTVLVPLMMLVFTFVPMLATFLAPSSQISLAILDRTGELAKEFFFTLDDTLKDGRPKYVLEGSDPFGSDFDKSRETFISRINDESLDILIDIPEDVFSSGLVHYFTRDVGNIQILEKFEENLTSVVLKKRLDREGMDYDRVKNLTKKVSLKMRRVTKSGTVEKRSFLADWAMVFVFIMILCMALLTWGISIQRSLIEEKGSRVIEVLLSSLEPFDLFLGKILGLGAVGLTQLTIWAITMLALGTYVYFASASLFGYISVSSYVLLYFLVYFVLGFLFYSSIFALVGAVCSTEQEAQQLQGVITLPLVVPILILMLVIQSPNSTVAVVLSIIPLFSPMLMLARIVILEPPFWQIALSIAVLMLSAYGAAYFSSRVFRVGILMYGKRPGLREILRWFKYA